MSQIPTGQGHEKQAAIAVTTKEAARLLSLSLTTIYQLMRAGELASFSAGGKSRRILVRSLYAYVERKRGDGNWRAWQHARLPHDRSQTAAAPGAAIPTKEP